ncbi:MAG: nucleotidyltransferase substrate binding protein [Defluviitaleaceae bacterium]|nr:nucleotidyltransferase substrate binding protein [Defluviitaleaceae bacterium]
MQDIRWKQRYSNYTSILNLLNSSMKDSSLNDFTELELIGLAKSFELCFELLWKLLKDYLEHENVEIGLISPKNILKAAASKGLLQLINADGDVLIKAHKSRNELVHIYDHEKFLKILKEIQEILLPEMVKVDNYFKGLVNNDE